MKESKIGLWSLTALVFSSMVGAGIFSLPQNMAEVAGARAVLIGWGVTGVGILALAASFLYLSRLRPDLDGGIYSYARAGFGDLVGFFSAWGYWLCATIGVVGYLVIAFAALGSFVDTPEQIWFGDGNTLAAFIGESCILWAVHLLVARGVQQAALFNLVATLAKSLPLLLFILFACYWFDPVTFAADQGGQHACCAGLRAGAQHHVDHPLGLYRHRRGSRLVGPCEEQAGRGHGHSARGSAGVAALCAHLGTGAGDIESPRARCPAQSLHGGADGPDDRLLGQGADQCRPHRLCTRFLRELDPVLGRGALQRCPLRCLPSHLPTPESQRHPHSVAVAHQPDGAGLPAAGVAARQGVYQPAAHLHLHDTGALSADRPVPAQAFLEW